MTITSFFRGGFAHTHFLKEKPKKGKCRSHFGVSIAGGRNLSVTPLRSQRLWCLFGIENFPWAPIGANPTRAPARRIECDLKINRHNSINPFIICIYHCVHLWKKLVKKTCEKKLVKKLLKKLVKKLVKKTCNEIIDFIYRSRCR